MFYILSIEKEYNKTNIEPTIQFKKERLDIKQFYELNNKNDYYINIIQLDPKIGYITKKRNERDMAYICGFIKPAYV